MATDDVIFDVLEMWLREWHVADIFVLEKSVVQKKEEVKLHMAHWKKREGKK